MLEKNKPKKINHLKDVASCLKAGEVGLCYTDTILGFVGLARPTQLKRINKIKKRKETHACILLVGSLQKAHELVAHPEFHNNDMEKYWPGPTTLIFKASTTLDDDFTVDGNIALRLPGECPVKNILKEINEPLLSSSANISGEKFCLDIDSVSDDILKNIDFIFTEKSGKSTHMPSKMLDLTQNKPKKLR